MRIALNKLAYLKSKLKMASDSLINIENPEFQLENAPKLNPKDKQIQSNSLTKSYSKNQNKLASFNQLLFLQKDNYVSKNLNPSKLYNKPQLFSQQKDVTEENNKAKDYIKNSKHYYISLRNNSNNIHFIFNCNNTDNNNDH